MVRKTPERAQEVHRIRVYGNFRKSKWEEKRKPSWQKLRERREKAEENSYEHLAFLRQLPCALCCASPNESVIDPHHLRGGEWAYVRGAGQRGPDSATIPLCRECHDDIERLSSRRHPDYILKRGGFHGEHLAKALWDKHQLRGTLEDYSRVMLAFFLQSSVAGLRAAALNNRAPAAGGRRPRAYRADP